MKVLINIKIYTILCHLKPQKRQPKIITIPIPLQIHRPRQICRLSRSDHQRPTIGHRWNQTESADGKTAVVRRPGALLYRQPKMNRDSYIFHLLFC